VENQETLDLLIQWGCSQAQGYLIARPMSPAALEDWIEQGRYTALVKP
jgi:EAL domain-containing protein (putative c-di-GMP-specific phosphodiesterase class I)